MTTSKPAASQASHKVVEAAPQKPTSLPDYGGRDSAVGQTLGSGTGGAAINPLAQAGRAFESLVVVLALVVGGLYLLKRFGLIKSDGSIARPPAKFGAGQPNRPIETAGESLELLTLIGTQTLPHSGGACLHLVALGSRTLLLGATSSSINLLTELEAGDLEEAAAEAAEPETPAEAAAFADYLTRVGLSSGPTNAIRAAEATLATATDRLQSLLAGSREEKIL